jgi:hypothetical protein
LNDDSRAHLRTVATNAVQEMVDLIEHGGVEGPATFGWLPRSRWRMEAQRALDDGVRDPLRARGLL